MEMTVPSNISYGCLFIHTSLDYVPHARQAIVASCIMNGIMSFAAIIGNVLVLVTIYKTPSLHTPSHCLVFMMATADVGVGLLAQPAAIARNAIALYLPGNSSTVELETAFCVSGVASELFGGFFVYFSLICVTAISFERYLSIHLHLRYPQIVTFSRTIKASVPMLLAPVIITILRLGSKGYGASFAALIVIGAVIFFISLGVIIYSNIKIAIILRRHTVQIGSQGIHGLRTRASLVKFRKSVTTMLLIFVLFLLCFLPYGCVGLVVIQTGMTKEMYIVAYITFPVIYLNSCLNPVLYCWRMKDLRRAANSLMKSHFSIASSHENSLYAL